MTVHRNGPKEKEHDPVADWRKLPDHLRVNLRNEGEFYAGSAQIRLVRSKFGTWTLQVMPLNAGFVAINHDPGKTPYQMYPVSKLGVHILVDSSTIDELKKSGVPIYLENL